MMRSTSIVIVAAAALMLVVACKSMVLETVMTTVEPYFHGPGTGTAALERITDKIYSFRWRWYRNLIAVTRDGLVIIDPMNPQMAAELHAALAEKFPGRPVRALIYSHYHLDHTRGGAELAPAEVIAHEKSPIYWQHYDVRDVLRPTRFIAGDTVLHFGDMEIHALYLGLSHTDTLYAFHFPSERLMFTADLGLVRSVPPVGVPDRYSPGYRDALDRIAAVDFDIFVPSHFGYGTRQDLIDWRNMIEDGRRLARDAIQRFGGLGTRRGQMRDYFAAVYYPMRDRYGDWHGFDEMFILNVVRDLEGEMLGH